VIGSEEVWNEEETGNAIWRKTQNLCSIIVNDTSRLQSDRALVLTAAIMEWIEDLRERMINRKPNSLDPGLKADLNSLYRELLDQYKRAKGKAEKRERKAEERER
jgi:hypothetical protein